MKSKPYEKMNEYLDFYEVLLTDKQREVMDYYFREDYSLSEIAENMNISRSAVQDSVKRTSLILENYEEKLKLVSKYHRRFAYYEELAKSDDEKIKKLSEKLKESEMENYE